MWPPEIYLWQAKALPATVEHKPETVKGEEKGKLPSSENREGQRKKKRGGGGRKEKITGSELSTPEFGNTRKERRGSSAAQLDKKGGKRLNKCYQGLKNEPLPKVR